MKNSKPNADRNISKKRKDVVAMMPVHLDTLEQICGTFNVGKETVKSWWRSGAPITKRGKGVNTSWDAEYNCLQAWKVDFYRQRQSELPLGTTNGA